MGGYFMSIRARCPHCGHRYKLGEELVGRKAKCKQCQQAFVIEAEANEVLPIERTEAGTPVFRHEANVSGFVPGEATPYLKQIERHIEKHLGPTPLVFHELISPHAHIDLHVVPPTHLPPSEDHPLGTNHFTIVTSGMSCKPMNVPEEADQTPRFAELMIALPENWPGMFPDGKFDDAAMKDERNWWPIKWLKMMARLPHEYDTFLGIGHTIPNGEGAEPFAANTKLGCMMVMPPLLCPKASELLIDDDVTISFYSLFPIYREEMHLKLKKGLDPLFKKFEEAEVTELIDPNRPNTCAKRGWFG
jgi:hypothetical protein